MGEDAQLGLGELSRFRACPDGRAEAALVAGEGALDLPAVAVDLVVEVGLHLSAVMGPGPLPAPTGIYGDDRGSDSQLVAAEDMVVLGVVGRIAQQAVETDVPTGLPHGRRKLWGILGGTPAQESPSPEVGLAVADHGELEPSEPFSSGFPLPPDVVAADVTALQPRGVGDPFGLLSDELQLMSAAEDGSKEGIECPPFTSLRCA